MGSTAERSRADEWSDHDFAVVCESGWQETLREDLGWLPHPSSIVAVGREHHDGFKAVYADGHVIEFAVVDMAELATFYANAYAVAYDRGGVAEVMAGVAARPVPGATLRPADGAAVFMAAILVGVGRARRGEVLSASGSVRGLALDQLVTLLREFSPPASSEDRDTLDPRRRFETSYPEWGRELAAALDAPVERCARQLLEIGHRHLSELWGDYPQDAESVVRRRLGWPDATRR